MMLRFNARFQNIELLLEFLSSTVLNQYLVSKDSLQSFPEKSRISKARAPFLLLFTIYIIEIPLKRFAKAKNYSVVNCSMCLY